MINLRVSSKFKIKKMKKYILSFIVLTFSFSIMAQSLSKANKLFKRRHYVEAAKLYTEIAAKKPSKEIFEKLGDSYFFNSKMKEASTWYGKLASEYPDEINATSVFRYIQTLKSLKQYEKIDDWTRKYNEISMTAKLDPTKTIDLVKKLSHSIIKNIGIVNLASNSKNSDFAPAFYNDKIIFASARKNNAKVYSWNQQPYLDLYTATVNNEHNTTNASSFSENLNSDLHEASVAFTNDGNTIYFTRNSKVKDERKVSHLKIYKAIKQNGIWTSITELPFSSNSYSVAHPTLNKDNTIMYFSSDMPGSRGSFDIYKVAIKPDGTFGKPKNLGKNINTKQREQFPFISENNDLYFASEGHPGLGGLDIFKSTLENGKFSKPKNLGIPFNSNMDDFSFIIKEKEQTGYFASNRLEGQGDDDIYSFYIESLVLFGKVIDKTTGELIPGADVTLFDANGKVLDTKNVGDKAYYEFNLDPNTSYSIKGTRDLYLPSTIDFETDYKGDLNKNILLELITYVDAEPKIEIVNKKPQIVLNPIYFDFNKWNIRPDAAKELDYVVAMMQKYPEMVIAIGSHTDSRGKASYNMILSSKRATSTLNYIISKGINPANISAQGYGESQPVNNCENHCTKQDHELNRRSEFVLVK